MARDTPLGFPAHTLPYRRGEFTTLSTVSSEDFQVLAITTMVSSFVAE